MIPRAVAIIVALTLAVPAVAGDKFTVKDKAGRATSTVERHGFLDRWDIKDPTTGRRTGTIERGPFADRYLVKDGIGRRVGIIEKRR